MKIAVKNDEVLVDSDGRVAGHDGGAVLARRLLRVFPDSVLIGPGARRCDGFDMVPLEFVDAENTVVINMDVIDSVDVWRTLRLSSDEPKVMNFMWWPTSRYDSRVEKAALALCCALFPTFANSERTAGEVREIVTKWEVQPLAERSTIAWVNLGFRHGHVQSRRMASNPVVLYPSIYMSDRKQPQFFFDVVERVHKRTPIQVEARLIESHLVSEIAMRYSRSDWIWIGPLTADRNGYWEALSRTTAFLATASEESYGMMYVEALAAGAVGIFPNEPWAHALVPDLYPFFYDTAAQAEEMLFRAVTDTEACLQEMDKATGDSFQEWLRARHDDDVFERVIVDRVREWFGV